jgi:putative MATE family efflux protein
MADEPADRRTRVTEFLEHPRRAVWTVGAPMMAGFMVHALYSIVDAAFIGRLGPQALAGATYVGALFFIAIALVTGLATGITANVAQALGARDQERADRLASNGLGLGLGIGIALAVFGLVGGPWLVPLLGAEGPAAEAAWEYFQLLSVGMPLFFFSTAIRSVLNAEGDARTPTVVLAISTVINLGLDPVFIFTLDLGIRGAALATLVAQTFSLSIFSYLVFVRRRTASRFRLSYVPPRRDLLWPVIALGLPATAGQLVMALGSGLFNRVLSEFGQLAVAGYGAGSKVDLIVAMPVIGLAGATVTVIGMFAGAGRADLIRSTAFYTCRWAVTIALALGVGAYFASDRVVGFFTDDPIALGIGEKYISYMIFAYPLMAFGMASGRILQGVGYGVPSLIITLVRVLGVSVPGAYLAVYLFDAPIQSIWIAAIAGGLVADVLAAAWLRQYLWRRDPTAVARRRATARG